jgi:hypothetical protein
MKGEGARTSCREAENGRIKLELDLDIDIMENG